MADALAGQSLARWGKGAGSAPTIQVFPSGGAGAEFPSNFQQIFGTRSDSRNPRNSGMTKCLGRPAAKPAIRSLRDLKSPGRPGRQPGAPVGSPRVPDLPHGRPRLAIGRRSVGRLCVLLAHQGPGLVGLLRLADSVVVVPECAPRVTGAIALVLGFLVVLDHAPALILGAHLIAPSSPSSHAAFLRT